MPRGEILPPELTEVDFVPEGPIKTGAIRPHHAVRRKPGYPTAGMTYGGLHESAEEAEAKRQEIAGGYRNSTRPAKLDRNSMNSLQNSPQAYHDTAE